jgi:hypothetical protein
MTKTEVQILRNDLQEGLKEIFFDTDWEAEVGSGTYSDRKATFKVEIIDNADGDGYKQLFEELAPLFGIDPSWYGVTFSTYHGTYTITKIKPKNRKYPIIAEKVNDGKPYKFSPEDIRSFVNKAREPQL